jgi:hypothetical protein
MVLSESRLFIVSRQFIENGSQSMSAPNSSDQTEQEETDSEVATKADLAALRTDIARTVSELNEHLNNQDQEQIEQDLKQYIRTRQRHNSARKRGPYLVLLYGISMTIAAFYFLHGWIAVYAMLIAGFSIIGIFSFSIMANYMNKMRDVSGAFRDRFQ